MNLKYTFLGVGIVMLAIAGYLGYRTITYINNAIEVEGRVVRNIESYDSDTGATYAPLVIFTTAAGERVEFIDSIRSYPATYQPEEIVPILYLPDEPATTASVKGFFYLWGAFAIVGGIGLIFFIVGIILVVKLE